MICEYNETCCFDGMSWHSLGLPRFVIRNTFCEIYPEL